MTSASSSPGDASGVCGPVAVECAGRAAGTRLRPRRGPAPPPGPPHPSGTRKNRYSWRFAPTSTSTSAADPAAIRCHGGAGEDLAVHTGSNIMMFDDDLAPAAGIRRVLQLDGERLLRLDHPPARNGAQCLGGRRDAQLGGQVVRPPALRWPWSTCDAAAPLCRIARRNRPSARGIARRAPTLIAPADSPATVTASGSPPNVVMLSRTHSSAATWSSRPRLGGASGRRANPSAPSR